MAEPTEVLAKESQDWLQCFCPKCKHPISLSEPGKMHCSCGAYLIVRAASSEEQNNA